MRRVCIVVNSRANYARIKTTIRALSENGEIDLKIIVGASGVLYRFGNVAEIIERDGFEIHSKSYTVVDGDEPISMVKTTALSLLSLSDIFDNLKPDVVVTVADRYETIATAIAATYMNIPLAHTQGGEITGSIDDSVRHAITKLAHIHFPATKRAAVALEKMGEDPNIIFQVGCPAIDLAFETPIKPISEVISRYGGVGANLNFSEPFVLVSQHPDTLEYSAARDQITQTLEAIKSLKIQAVWLWPNVDSGSDLISKKLREFKESEVNLKIAFFRNFKPDDYINVLRSSKCIIGNSSSGIREASFLGIPAVNVGNRQEGREKPSNVMDAPYDYLAIAKSIKSQVEKGIYAPDFTYGEGNAGRKMAEILATHDFSLKKRKITFDS